MICRPPSELFYKNKLWTDKAVKERRPLSDNIDKFWQSKSPIIVYDIVEDSNASGQHFTGKVDIHSKSNNSEAWKVVSWYFVCNLL